MAETWACVFVLLEGGRRALQGIGGLECFGHAVKCLKLLQAASNLSNAAPSAKPAAAPKAPVGGAAKRKPRGRKVVSSEDEESDVGSDDDDVISDSGSEASGQESGGGAQTFELDAPSPAVAPKVTVRPLLYDALHLHRCLSICDILDCPVLICQLRKQQLLYNTYAVCF